jgi:hypothetical protein
MPALVVTIDTEEEGRWSGSYPAHGNTCRNIRLLPRIHQIITRLEAIPTYLVDYPVAVDPQACKILAGFAADGSCEIGAHLHPWCNPPFESSFDNSGTTWTATYPHTLPQPVQQAKLERLCEAIQEGIGIKPTSYRAGRWGFNHTSIPVLERLRIRVDTSVSPLWWERGEGAPAFIRAPLRPYRLNRNDVCRVGNSNIVEVPTSNLVATAYGPAIEQIVHLVGPLPGLRRVLKSLGFKSLRPELFSLQEMRDLADAIALRGLEVFNVMFHSSVALPGVTPYVSNEVELDRFCHRLEGLLEYILSQHQATALPLSSVPSFLGDSILSGEAT